MLVGLLNVPLVHQLTARPRKIFKLPLSLFQLHKSVSKNKGTIYGRRQRPHSHSPNMLKSESQICVTEKKRSLLAKKREGGTSPASQATLCVHVTEASTPRQDKFCLKQLFES